jgi:uracil-DNA glycosylase family 4
MDALRNYLAWQGEIGGDEVILTAAPAARFSTPPPIATSAPVQGSPLAETSPRSSPPPPPVSAGQETPVTDGLYQMLAKSLQGSESAAREKRSATLGLPPADTAPRKPADPGLPAFGSHAEYRDHLEKNLRALHTALQNGEETAAGAGAGWKLVHGAGPDYAPLALVALEPGPADIAACRPFQGEGGVLLEKMMRAIKLDLGQLYRTLVVKWAGPGRIWTRRDLVRLLPLLHAELALAKAPVVLLLGEACAQAVLKTGKGLEELRGTYHRVDGAPGRDFAVTWHPDELEGKEELKRKAWKDLQWLQTRLQGD